MTGAPEGDLADLSAAEVAPAAQVLARAFFTEPLALHVLPGETTRMASLAEIFAWRLRYARLYGHAWRPSASLDAVAIVVEPDPEHYSGERRSRSGYEQVAEALGRAEAARIGETASAVVGVCEEAARRTCDATDWELQFIAVDPGSQGAGVGARLIDAIHRYTDGAGAGMRLFTLRETNLPFYMGHGYAVVAEGREPGSGLDFWVLRRQARVHSAPEL